MKYLNKYDGYDISWSLFKENTKDKYQKTKKKGDYRRTKFCENRSNTWELPDLNSFRRSWKKTIKKKIEFIFAFFLFPL